MRFKNAVKILATIFSAVWPLMLYYLIAALILAAGMISTLLPIINEIRNTGLGTEFTAFIGNIFGGGTYDDFSSEFSGLLLRLSSVFTEHFISFGFFILVSGFLSRALFGLAELPLMKKISGHMSANANYGFTGLFISSFGNSVLLQLFKLIFFLPLDCLMFGTLYLLTFMSRTAAGILLLPFSLVAALVLFLALKRTLSTFWAALIADGQGNTFRAFGKNIKLIFSRRFGKVYALRIFTSTMAFAIIVFFGIFTLGFGLLIILPTLTLFNDIQNSVLYYTATDRRYYTDSQTVYSGAVQE